MGREESIALGPKQDPEVRGQHEQRIEGNSTRTRTAESARNPGRGREIHPAHAQRVESVAPLLSWVFKQLLQTGPHLVASVADQSKRTSGAALSDLGTRQGSECILIEVFVSRRTLLLI